MKWQIKEVVLCKTNLHRRTHISFNSVNIDLHTKFKSSQDKIVVHCTLANY